MKKLLPLLFVAIFSIIIFGCGGGDDNGGGTTDPPPVPDPRLVVGVHQDPGLASVDHAVWDSIDEITVPVGTENDYNANTLFRTDLNAKMKALIGGSYLYIRAEWNDDDADNRFRELQARIYPGTNDRIEWNIGDTVLVNNEDRFYLMFDQGGTNGADCMSMCHSTVNGSGRRLYGTADDDADVWHWKAHRTGLAGLADDMHVTATTIEQDPQDQTPNDNLYFQNVNIILGGLTDRPVRLHPDTTEYTGPGLIEGEYILWETSVHKDMDWVPDFASEDSTGLYMPGYYLNPTSSADGSRWDVHVIQEHDGANWTVVFRRLLNSGDAADINFTGMDSVSISLAIGDNNGMKHWGRRPFYLVFP
ncbi:MAG: hypothetical protein KAR42_06675 [candidate division Zixibacteria bacterium]|nr:hypothetical protein [candidate division Zixibacteria bacterium]